MKYSEIFESENIERKVWHITPKANVSKIMKQGLIPKIGRRSKSAKEKTPAIYVFPDSISMEDALTNWLDNEFEDVKLSILELTVPSNWITEHAIRWEAQILHPVPPSMIKILVLNIDSWHGEYPDGNPPEGWFPK
jgi:CRISPR/Cas system-associated endonuclease Cas3-HD